MLFRSGAVDELFGCVDGCVLNLLEIFLHLVPEHFEAIDGVSLDDLDLILGAVDQGCGVIRGLLGPVHHVVEWLAIAFLPFLTDLMPNGLGAVDQSLGLVLNPSLGAIHCSFNVVDEVLEPFELKLSGVAGSVAHYDPIIAFGFTFVHKGFQSSINLSANPLSCQLASGSAGGEVLEFFQAGTLVLD